MNWQAISALVLAVGTLGAFTHWVVRTIVHQELETVREDISVLRAAVFNHVAHGEKPDEGAIRERMGYERER